MSGEVVAALIQDYLAAVERAVRVLVRVTGNSEPLLAVRSEGFPKSGVLPGGGAYRFHGVGCEVQLGEMTVDFDWGPGGRYGGFDAWRLARFSEQRGNPKSEKAIEAELLVLENQGLIEAPRLEPSPHLYYWPSRSEGTSESDS